MITKKNLLIMLVVVLGVVNIFTVAAIIKYRTENGVSNAQLASASPTPTDINSGVAGNNPTPQPADTQFAKLFNSLPITTQSFAIDIDYAYNKFVVTVYNPRNQNYSVFQKWIKDNGFSLIPSSKFVFYYQ